MCVYVKIPILSPIEQINTKIKAEDNVEDLNAKCQASSIVPLVLSSHLPLFCPFWL